MSASADRHHPAAISTQHRCPGRAVGELLGLHVRPRAVKQRVVVADDLLVGQGQHRPVAGVQRDLAIAGQHLADRKTGGACQQKFRDVAAVVVIVVAAGQVTLALVQPALILAQLALAAFQIAQLGGAQVAAVAGAEPIPIWVPKSWSERRMFCSVIRRLMTFSCDWRSAAAARAAALGGAPFRRPSRKVVFGFTSAWARRRISSPLLRCN